MRKKLQILTIVTWVTFPWCWRPPFARYCTQSCSKLLSQSLWLLDLSLPSDGLPPVHTLRWNWFINNTGRWFSTGFTKRLDIFKSYMYSKLLFTCLYHLTPEPLSLQTNEAILHRLCFPTMSLQHPQYLLAGINYHNHLLISLKLHLLIRCRCTVVSFHPNYTHFIWIFQYFQHHVLISAIHLKYFNSFLLQEGLPIKKQKIRICT